MGGSAAADRTCFAARGSNRNWTDAKRLKPTSAAQAPCDATPSAHPAEPEPSALRPTWLRISKGARRGPIEQLRGGIRLMTEAVNTPDRPRVSAPCRRRRRCSCCRWRPCRRAAAQRRTRAAPFGHSRCPDTCTRTWLWSVSHRWELLTRLASREGLCVSGDAHHKSSHARSSARSPKPRLAAGPNTKTLQIPCSRLAPECGQQVFCAAVR